MSTNQNNLILESFQEDTGVLVDKFNDHSYQCTEEESEKKYNLLISKAVLFDGESPTNPGKVHYCINPKLSLEHLPYDQT